MSIKVKQLHKGIVTLEQLQKQIEPANCDGFNCLKVNTATKNFAISRGAEYPKAIRVHGQIYKLWINAINDDFYYVSPEHQRFIDEIMKIDAYDFEKEIKESIQKNPEFDEEYDEEMRALNAYYTAKEDGEVF